MVLRWHAELKWLKMPPAQEHIPRTHRQVSFMELALDFEAFAGRPLPQAPQLKYAGGDLSLQEKGRVLRLIVTLVGRATERESIFPVRMRARSCRDAPFLPDQRRCGHTWRGSAHTGKPDGHKSKKHARRSARPK